MRSGGLLRIELKILLSALSTPDSDVWSMALGHLIPLFDRYAQTYADTESRNKVLHILAHLHDALHM